MPPGAGAPVPSSSKSTPCTWPIATRACRSTPACVAAYAFSPIDLIPDFIPVLGYLDDLILVPLGVLLALKMIPAPVMAECRVKAQEALSQSKPVNKLAAAVIVLVWLGLAALGGYLLVKLLRGL